MNTFKIFKNACEADASFSKTDRETGILLCRAVNRKGKGL